jgi:hypothetical protein
MQQRASRLAPLGAEDGMGGAMWRGRPPPQGGQAPRVEGMNRVAHGLVVAAQEGGNLPGVLAPCAGPQDLAAASDERIGRP